MRTERKMTDKTGIAWKRLAAFSCAIASSIAAAAPQALPAWTEPVTGIVFVALPKGCFQMGSAQRVEADFDSHWERIGYRGHLAEDEMPRHEACVDAFWMAKTEVSQADWHKVMGGDVPADGGRRAKVGVTWTQATQFAERLSAQTGGKVRFRLPTEAEWEYACRAGTKGDDAAKDMDEVTAYLARSAWYAGSPKRSYEALEVGVLEANAFGLHDMLGNAWEWTQDSYQPDAYARHALFNPRTEAGNALRVLRGGSFRTEQRQVRCAMRGRYDPAATMDNIGLRLVRER